LGRFGKEWSESDQERLMGVSTSTWVEYVTERLEGAMPPNEVLHSIVSLMVSAYEGGDVPLLPGATEALEHCAGGYRVGLASGSPRKLIEAALTGADWHRFFEQVLSSDECARGKPAPDVYLEIMNSMDLSPEGVVVVEDSAAGVLAGKAAQAKVVAVPRGFASRDNEAFELADARLESLRELPTALTGL
jgi:HAD superfamily hydrolase (TIGR01509 family)